MNRKYIFPLMLTATFVLITLASCHKTLHGKNRKSAHRYDVIIRNGTLYDGTGQPPRVADIAIRKQRLVRIGQNLKKAKAKIEIDATGLAVAPGFINVLSQSHDEILADGRVDSDIRQGVTLELFGEGFSMGPWNDKMKRDHQKYAAYDYPVEWSTLAEYFAVVMKKGISPNIASTVGAGIIRNYVLGDDSRAPNADELRQMRALVAEAMQQGAIGVSTALAYVPHVFANKDELIALASEAAKYGGVYTSHIRSEGRHVIGAVKELIDISRQANIRAQIHHFKIAGVNNWDKFDEVTKLIDQARKDGLQITVNIYPYTRGATGLSAMMPAWVKKDGMDKFIENLGDPNIREQLKDEITQPAADWENYYELAGGAEYIWPLNFRNPALQKFSGMALSQIAEQISLSPVETAIELIMTDKSYVSSLYRLASEDNLLKQMQLPYLCGVCTDESAINLDNQIFAKRSAHPRSFGAFPRFLSKYVREAKVMPLARAIHVLTGCPASFYRLDKRGRGYLQEGYFADLVIFDPKNIIDQATYESPKQYPLGIQHVFVNGIQVIKEANHTGAMPGQIVRGMGYNAAK